jgi:4-amino-4-deoxy-L-arabinose transferase-like glycosyltransferase
MQLGRAAAGQIFAHRLVGFNGETGGMDGAVAQSAPPGALAAAVAFARRQPGKVLALVLGLHLVVWTALPILVCPNLQLDLVEDLALGKEWQLGYWKHPPLPWWLADLFYRLTGQIDAVYVLGPLAVVLCLYGAWLLAREVAGGFTALIAVLVLEGVHFYNFSAVKFAHDQMQLPFWTFTALFFYRALKRGRLLDWMLAGACLAGAFWSKYAAFALAATLGLLLLLDPVARRAWRTPGPFVMAAVFLVVLAPNLWWLVEHDFLPFRYVDARARPAAHAYQYLLYPLQWTASQILFLAPAIALLALLWIGRKPTPPASLPAPAAFDRRYVTALALGPFLITTLIALALGRLPVAMWGYPLWSFAPLAALLWLGLPDKEQRLQWLAAGLIAVLIAFPAAYGAAENFEPLFRDRAKATQFPGQVMADTITREWHDRFGTALPYVGGGEFATNNLAVYSADRPHAIPHGDPNLAPWVDPADLRRRGAVLVWEGGGADEAQLAQWRAIFSVLELQPILVLARQTRFPVRPARIGFAFVPPRP